MRGILGMVLLVTVFCAYWFLAAHMLRSQQVPLGPEGLNATAASVTGFPAQFRVALQQPSWPARGWSASGLQAQAPSYWPFDIHGTIAAPQRLHWRRAAWQLDGADMSFALRTDPLLAVHSARLDGGALQVGGPVPFQLTGLSIALDPADRPTARQLTGSVRGLTVPGILPNVVQGRLDAILGYDQEPDLRGMAQLETLDLTDARLDWDNVQIQATGRLARAPDGRLDGEIVLTISGWRDLLGLLRSSGLLPRDQAPMIEMMAQSMAEDDRLTLPLNVSRSTLGLGPITLLDLGAF